jgi:multicomponent Na+:H+ antiporter subunit D
MVDYLPLAAVLTPLIGVLVVVAAHRVSRLAGNAAAVGVSAVTFAATVAMYPTITSGRSILMAFETGFPVKLSFYVDGLGLALGLVASLLWLLASLYAVTYMSHEHHPMRYDMFSMFSLGGMMGIVFTGNLFTLYIFFELMAILSYVLVIHEESTEALRAGLKYLFMGIVGGLALLAAIVATYVATGSVDIMGTGMPALANSPYVGLIFWSYIFGFAVKAGMFPVHVWLPDAHPVAPSPASALLSGVMIKAGIYGMIRTVFAIFGRETLAGSWYIFVLFILAVVTMLFASAVAISQTELKRLLAYSSIAQIGYMVLGISMLTSQGLAGSVLHVINHALMKGTLFLAAGSIIVMTGKRQLRDLAGLGRRMPLTMACFTIAALSMIGFPPFCGFISKWTLALGALEGLRLGVFGTGIAGVAITALLVSSLLNVVYYGPIVIRAWFGEGGEGEHVGHGAAWTVPANPAHGEQGGVEVHDEGGPGEGSLDPPWTMSVPMVVLTAGIFIFGVFPQLPKGLADLVVKAYFG